MRNPGRPIRLLPSAPLGPERDFSQAKAPCSHGSSNQRKALSGQQSQGRNIRSCLRSGRMLCSFD